jgi:hypothetical protein
VECEEHILKERGTHLWNAKYTLKYTYGMRNTQIGRIKNTLVECEKQLEESEPTCGM